MHAPVTVVEYELLRRVGERLQFIACMFRDLMGFVMSAIMFGGVKARTAHVTHAGLTLTPLYL